MFYKLKEIKMEFLLFGVIAGSAFILLFAKIGLKKIANYEIIVDILSTVGLVLMFAGTFAGMVAGLLGGIIISIFLFVYKRAFGYQKPIIKKMKLNWIDQEPKW
tara:strand:+ start:1698 stop:2009 length:312 start_codon:yes stop_codon:yes gene_type:complete